MLRKLGKKRKKNASTKRKDPIIKFTMSLQTKNQCLGEMCHKEKINEEGGIAIKVF